MPLTTLELPVRRAGDPDDLSEGDQLIHIETFEVITLKRRPRGGRWWHTGGGIILDAAINPTKEQRPHGPLWLLIERRS